MLLKKYQIMLLLVVYTSVIFGSAIPSYLRRIQGINDTNVQNVGIETGEPSTVTEHEEIRTTTDNTIDKGMEVSCESFQCHNNGTCMMIENTTVCVCQYGYTGPHCDAVTGETSMVTEPEEIRTTTENTIDTATEDPCKNYCHNEGTCFNQGTSICVCQPGYSGRHCEIKTDENSTVTQPVSLETTTEILNFTVVDPCISMPCQNQGICIKEGRHFICHCMLPYLGEFCEKDPCTENPCLNGGTCFLTEYSYKCQCRYPYSGDTCQYDACHDNPCFNGGTCEKNGDHFVCKCRYGYYGNVCEKEGYESTVDDVGNYTFDNYTESTEYTLNFNLTTVKPGICFRDTDCLNNGICRNSYCECPPNFEGYWCEKSLLCEKLAPTCRAMGATCRIVGLNAICDCPQDKMYHPKSGICEDICDPWKCIHGRCEIDGRTYKCNCDPGYSGDQCDETMQTKAEKSSVMFTVAISIMVLICLLLIGQMCYFCRNEKIELLTNDGFLSKYSSSGSTSEA